MKRAKIYKVLCIVIILSIALPKISYAITADTEPPTIQAISMDTKTVVAGNKIQFDFSTNDNLSGVRNIMIEWILDGTNGENENHLVFEFQNIINGTFSCDKQIQDTTLGGKWVTSAIQIWDAEGNLRTYYRNSVTPEVSGSGFDISTLDFVVENNSIIDTEAPVLNSIKILDINYSVPCDVTIEADISDNSSTTVNAQIDYSTALPSRPDWTEAVNGIYYNNQYGYSPSYILQKQANGKYYTTIHLDNEHLKLYLVGIRLSDEVGNSVYYTNHIDLLKDIYGESYNYAELEANIDIQPSNYKLDDTAPEVISFSYNKQKLYTPNTLITTFDIIDDASGVSQSLCGMAYFRNEDGTFNEGATISKAYDNYGILMDSYESKLEFSRYDNPGEIYMYKVVVYDLAGNKKTLSIDDGTLEKRIVNIITDETKYTLETSTTLSNYIDEISNLSDGSIVLCDISINKIVKKELFDSIKGKDITIVFEDVFGNEWDKQGIQWIINGKDITNETKNVNMSINLSMGYYCPYLLKDYVFPEVVYNPDLPEEEEIISEREQQVKIAQEYFKYLSSLGYKNTEKYLNKTIEIINSSFTSVDGAIMEAVGYIRYLSINFADNGELPCKTIVRIKPDYATRNIIGAKGLYLFYVDGDKYTKISEGIEMNEDDYYDFVITHNSEYWLIGKNVNEVANVLNITNGSDVTNIKIQNPETDDNRDIFNWMVLLLFSLTGMIMSFNYVKKYCDNQ